MSGTTTNNKSNVTAGKPRYGGAAFTAPAGSTLPTDASTALDAAFVGLGYISEDGLTNDGERSSENIKAWGGDIVLSVQTEKTDTFTVTFIEALNPEVLKIVHGDSNVTGSVTEGLSVSVNSKELTERAWVFDMVMNGGVLKRVVIPAGKVTNVSEVVYNDEEAVGYECEITAYPDSADNTHYEYFIKPTA